MIEFREKIPYLRYLEMQDKLRKFRRECILFLEHAPTITGGINYNPENLLVKPEFLESMGIQIHWTQRGGDFTAHEPGQLVLYSHVDLKREIFLSVLFRKFTSVRYRLGQVHLGFTLDFRF
ncbi:hypothetical protein LEP1GSC170_0758 [Leptospira interrogans serovar Bataviae str. HAI135]|nr:hypothetical protein LEP1GSC170_0758 [Leptospira interrogans serovar Bataviae str. HAI135]